ncbi:TonB-dependent siderophore receptor [Pseudomonas pseudonitroreducens]|uniref:TonB-dependent siderophore receptor n=1 Tax=Pseudomonas pseudonitroreducens TaxID=2892326 RepID=UPI001F2FD760|nr:TonB-dependent siderophore receptor [Pseudomonas pseudonitroreducens]
MSRQDQHFPSNKHPLFLAIALSLAAVGPLSVSAVAGAEQAQRQSFDIPIGPLARQLTELAAQTGLLLAADAELTRDRQSQAVRGNYSAEEALDLMLMGSGLSAQRSTAQGNGKRYQLVLIPQDDAALEMSETTIMGQGMGQATENSGSYTPGLTSVGSKTPTSLKETPQSVSVITRQLMDDRQIADLNDAMKAVPGITVQSNTFRIQDFYSRGFAIQNIQLDGAAPMALGTTAGSFYSSNVYDMAEFDHVEVLRGSSALFGGTGDPGGIINLVRKRPLDTYQLKFSASAGSWDNYRSEFDVTGPLGFDGKLRGRAVVAYQDRQYFTDNRATDKPIFYGVLEADVTDDTLLTAGLRFNKVHETGTANAVPRYSNGVDLGLPRHTGLSTTWAYADGFSREYFAKLDQRLSDDWKLNLSYTNIYDTIETNNATTLGSVNPVTGAGVTRYGTWITQWSEQNLWDANVSGNFSLFGLNHQLTVGGDYQDIDSRWQGTPRFSTAGGAVNVFDPNSTPWNDLGERPDVTRNYSPNSQTQYGLYSSLRLQLAEPLHLILGARVQRYKFDQTYQTLANGTWGVQSRVDMREPTRTTPFGGIVYDLSDEWAAYASYAEIFKPQQNLMAGPLGSGSTLDPMTGKTYETGLKGELFDGKLNTSVALYYTKREDQAVLDPQYEATSVLFGGNCCYVNGGEVTSKGIDMEISGELLPDWMVMASYTLNLNKNRTVGGELSTITPKHLAKLFTTYRLPGDWSKFRVGGGVDIQSATKVSGTASTYDSNGKVTQADVPFDYQQSGYAVWNALVDYQLDEHWNVALNGNNLFDKKYYQTVGTSTYGNVYGDPRNFMLTVRATY